MLLRRVGTQVMNGQLDCFPLRRRQMAHVGLYCAGPNRLVAPWWRPEGSTAPEHAVQDHTTAERTSCSGLALLDWYCYGSEIGRRRRRTTVTVLKLAVLTPKLEKDHDMTAMFSYPRPLSPLPSPCITPRPPHVPFHARYATASLLSFV
jgi:hypothetical protein